MDSTLQSLIVTVIIGAAALFVGTKWYRTFASARKKKGCGSDCGCSSE